MKNPEPLFFIARDEGVVAGPYDVVQMAGLLRRKIITGETMTRMEGKEDWKAFSWQPQFAIAREMPTDAVSMRVVELDEEAAARARGQIPMPSLETIIKLVGLIVGALLAGGASFLLAWLDVTTGWCLLLGGVAAMAVAQCMIMARLLDENYWTLGLVWFVPGGDIYYFLSNIWAYFPWFCVKYIGAAVAMGAVIGLATHSAH